MISVFTRIVIAIKQIINSSYSGEGSESGDSWGNSTCERLQARAVPPESVRCNEPRRYQEIIKPKYIGLVIFIFCPSLYLLNL